MAGTGAQPKLSMAIGIMVILLTSFYIGRSQELIPYLVLVPYGKICVGLALVMYLGYTNTTSFVELCQYRLVRLLLLFLFLMAMSIPYSMWPGQSYDFFVGHIKLLLFVLIMISFGRGVADIEIFLWGLIVAVCGLMIVAYTQQEGVYFTASATYDRNDFALVLATCIPLLYFKYRTALSVVRVFLLLLIVAAVLAIIKTESRGGALALFTALGGIFFIEYQTKKWRAMLLFVLLAVIGSYLVTAEYKERIYSIFDTGNNYNYNAQAGRLEIWKRTLPLIVQNPLLGAGVGAFSVAEGTTHSEAGGKWSAAHNCFLQVGVELGVPGLAVFLLMLITSFKFLACKTPGVSAKDVLLCSSLKVSFTVFYVGAFFLSAAYSGILYYLFALVIILQKGRSEQLVAR